MLEKTYRIHQIINTYEDCNDCQKGIIKRVATCYIEERYTFTITNYDFENFSDDKVTPAYALECFDEVNEMNGYTFTFNFEYQDSENWRLTATMIDRVYDNLDSELD